MSSRRNIVIVGGSTAGFICALTIRRYNKDARITVVRREKKALITCGIPYIFGTLFNVEKDLLPDKLLAEGGIDLLIDEVRFINRSEKAVLLSSGRKISYDKLVLTTGSIPVKPPIPGIDLENVFFARKDVEYLQRLLSTLEKVKDVVIIGGGFVGVEFAEQFRRRGLNVTIIEMLPHCLQLNFDEEYCVMAEEKLREMGVRVIVNEKVEEIVGDEGRVKGVKLASGERVRADVVLVAVGVKPEVTLAREAQLKIGEMGGVWVNEHMQTSDIDIFAAGDCAEKFSFFTGKPVNLRLASIAAREAKIVAANLSGINVKNPGTIGCFATMINDLGLGVVGLTEKAARDAGFNVLTGVATTTDKHPGAMPGARTLKVKLIFDRSTKTIIGGEIAGGPTTAELANIVSVMIERRMTIEDVAFFQYGTHPALTASPRTHPIAYAAEDALSRL
ncbi:MAG: FAD-dependent oxidoreductase [Candidatus Nezhaarchaeales archaeon]